MHLLARYCLSVALTLFYAGLLQAEEAAPAETKTAPPPPAPVYFTDTPVTIDGKLDEPCWQKAQVFRADYINNKQGVLTDEPHMSVRLAYDDHYLYIAYEIWDKDLQAAGTGQLQGPKGNQRESIQYTRNELTTDLVEFFITFDDPQYFWELHHNALNKFNDVWISLVDPKSPINLTALCPWGIIFCPEEYVQDEKEYTVAMAVQLKLKADGTPSTVNDSSDVDTGYTAELRLPLGPIGAPVKRRATPKPGEDAKTFKSYWIMDGQTMRLLVVLLMDGEMRYLHSSPTRKGDWFHKTVPDYPLFIFTREPKP